MCLCISKPSYILQPTWCFQNAKFVVTCPPPTYTQWPSIALRISRPGFQPWGSYVMVLFHHRASFCMFPSTRNALCALPHRVNSSGGQLNHHLLKEALAGLPGPGFSVGPWPSHPQERRCSHWCDSLTDVCLRPLVRIGSMLSLGQCLARGRGSLNACRMKK